MKQKSFDGIYTLRLFAFLNIFMLHVGALSFYVLPHSAEWAVAFFFFVSGFLNGYKYYQKDLKNSEIISFTIKKMKKILPLYFLCLFFMVPFSALGNTRYFSSDFNFSLKTLFYNITLMQSWVPKKEISMGFTGVGWYLSTFMFLIFMTIPIIKLLKKLNFESRVNRIFIFIFFIVFSCVYIEYMQYFNLTPDIFGYIFPLGRLFEYVIGIIFGIIILKNEESLLKFTDKHNSIISRLIMTVLEIIVVISLFIQLKIFPPIRYYNNSVLWFPINMILIIVFCYSNGYLKRLLCNKSFVYLGQLTPFAYLIHEVINMYVYLIPFNIPKNRYIIMVLFLTFVSSYYYKKMNFKKE